MERNPNPNLCAIADTSSFHRTYPLHPNPPRWPRERLISNLTTTRHVALISARKLRRRGKNEDRDRSLGSSSSSPYSSPSQSSDSPPTSMSIGSASQCSLANRRRWEVACSGVSRVLGEIEDEGIGADPFSSHSSCVLGCLWCLFNNDAMGLCQGVFRPLLVLSNHPYASQVCLTPPGFAKDVGVVISTCSCPAVC